MKKRSKEEMTLYRRELRARKKAQPVTPAENAPVTPVTPARIRHNVTPDHVTPVTPAVIPCAECERLRAELLQERAEVSRFKDELAAMQQQARPTAGTPHGKARDDDADALRKRVIADKVERINSYSRGHVIGTART